MGGRLPERPKRLAVHAVPEFEAHDLSADCWCKPRFDAVARCYYHNSRRCTGWPLLIAGVAALVFAIVGVLAIAEKARQPEADRPTAAAPQPDDQPGEGNSGEDAAPDGAA